MHLLTLGSSNRVLFGQATESTQSTVNSRHISSEGQSVGKLNLGKVKSPSRQL